MINVVLTAKMDDAVEAGTMLLRDNISSAIESDLRYFGRSSYLPNQAESEKVRSRKSACTRPDLCHGQAIPCRDEVSTTGLAVAG
jgi:hypothetical protein